jgi:hypothetical protein
MSLDYKRFNVEYISNKKNNIFLVGLAISTVLFFAVCDYIVYFFMLEIKRICTLNFSASSSCTPSLTGREIHSSHPVSRVNSFSFASSKTLSPPSLCAVS